MNLYKLILPISATLLFIGTSSGQGTFPGPYLKDGVSIYDKVYSYVNRIGKEMMNRECGVGCFFVKFSVDSIGNVTDVQSNNGSWNVLDTLVKSALISTNGQWETSKKKKNYANKTFLLPVLFSIGHCQTSFTLKTNSLTETLAAIPALKDTADLNSMIQKDMSYNFMHMTDFNRPGSSPPFSIYTALECILLAPIYLFTLHA